MAELGFSGGGTNVSATSSGGTRYPVVPAYFRTRTGSVSANDLDIQTPLAEALANIPAEGQPIPICYGEREVGGQMFAVDYSNGQWTVGYIVCLGEIEQYVEVYINGVGQSDSPSWPDGVAVVQYNGTNTQLPDPTLSAAISGYNDDMVIANPYGDDVGVAYIVLTYTDSHYDTFPEVIAHIKGMKVYTPGASPEIAYSTNPALHLGDYMASSLYGAGRTNDTTSLTTLQTYCDDTTATSPNEVLRQSGLLIREPQEIERWIEVLREYAGAWIAERGSTVYYYADTTGSSARTFNESDIMEGSLKITRRDSKNVPTVIRASYTDKTNNKWRSAWSDAAKTSGVDAGTVPWRESRINLEAVDRHSQAYRMAVTRLNKFTLQDLTCEWQCFDEALELEISDIVTLSHPLLGSPSAKLLRLVEEPLQVRPGRWLLKGEEYDPAVYDSTVVSAATYNDGGVPKGGVPTPPSGLSVVSVPYQTVDQLWHTRFQISWTGPTDNSLVSHYHIEVIQTDVSPHMPVWDTTIPSSNTSVATPALEDNGTFTINVYSINTVLKSNPVTTSATLDPSTTPPSTVGALDAQIYNGIVHLSWDAATDAEYYVVKTGAAGSPGSSWATADTVDNKLKATQISIDATAHAGSTRRFFVWAYSNTGQGAVAASADVFAIPAIASGITVFYQGSVSDGVPTALAAGDLFYDTDNDDRPYQATAAGDDQINVSPQEWVLQNQSLQNKVDLSYITMNPTAQTVSFTAVTMNEYLIDTETLPSPLVDFEMTLPTDPSAGERVLWHDIKGYFDVRPLHVMRATDSPTDKIMGEDKDLKCDVRFWSGGLVYVDSTTGWALI